MCSKKVENGEDNMKNKLNIDMATESIGRSKLSEDEKGRVLSKLLFIKALREEMIKPVGMNFGLDIESDKKGSLTITIAYEDGREIKWSDKNKKSMKPKRVKTLSNKELTKRLYDGVEAMGKDFLCLNSKVDASIDTIAKAVEEFDRWFSTATTDASELDSRVDSMKAEMADLKKTVALAVKNGKGHYSKLTNRLDKIENAINIKGTKSGK